MTATLNRTPTEADLANLAKQLALRPVPRGTTRPHLIGRQAREFLAWDDPPVYRAEYLVAAARELLRLGLTDTTSLERTPVVEALEHAWALLRLTEEIDR